MRKECSRSSPIGMATLFDENEQPTYWRADDVRDPYKCRVTVLKDLDGDGSVQKDEHEYADYLVWDYHRDTTDPAANQTYREFLSVEEEVESEDGETQCICGASAKTLDDSRPID